jgi:TolA-binding protein
VRAEAKALASDAALDYVKIDTEETNVESRVGNATRKGERDRGNSGASQGGAQGASDEEMKESAEQKAEGLSNSSDRNTGGWEENAEDDEERREVKGRGRVTPKGSAHKGAFQPGSRAALSKVYLTASADFLCFFNQYVAVTDNLLIGTKNAGQVWGQRKRKGKGKGTGGWGQRRSGQCT